uniref:Cmyb_C domain-containing protein n=1 Tax=Macrostomum lignano TaxID=282301 RepID=A0A1I8G7C0_9PLAT
MALRSLTPVDNEPKHLSTLDQALRWHIPTSSLPFTTEEDETMKPAGRRKRRLQPAARGHSSQTSLKDSSSRQEAEAISKDQVQFSTKEVEERIANFISDAPVVRSGLRTPQRKSSVVLPPAQSD